MAPLFKEATLGAIDLGEEEFIEACKNLIKNSTLPQRFLILNRHLADRSAKPPVSPQLTGKPAINPVSHVLSFNNDYASSDVFQRLALGRELYLKGKAPPPSKKTPLSKPSAHATKNRPVPFKKTAQPAPRAEPGSEHLSEQAEEHSHTLNEEEGNSGGGSPEKIFKQQSQISERPSEQNVTSDPENTHPYAAEHGEEEHHDPEAAEEEQPEDEEAGSDRDEEN